MKPTAAYARFWGSAGMRESPPVLGPARVSELELQARFYAGEFGEAWRTECGREVRLINPGEWNREAGPDFRQAVLVFDDEPQQVGDLEIDVEAIGWEAHSHATNPDFAGVLLHCFFREGRRRSFARTTDHRAVPQVRLGPLPDGTAKLNPSHFIPEAVSSVEIAQSMIALAARHRLEQKMRVLERARRLHGPRAALWQALAAALGYRRNSLPLALLAQRVSPRRAAGNDGEALLFGLAGFLEDRPQGIPEEGSKAYWRQLWERWWKLRHGESRLILPPTAWQFTGARPANHPHRRVAALAVLAPQLERLARALESGEDKLFSRLLSGLSHPFWDHHWHLDGRPLAEEKTLALVGKNRLTDILINVWTPWRAAEGAAAAESSFAWWQRLVPGQVPRKVRDLAAWVHPELELTGDRLRSAATQQGLLQLGRDFFGVESPRTLEQRLLSP